MLTQSYLKECFSYNERTGLVTWKVRPQNHFQTIRGWRSFSSNYSGSKVGCLKIRQGGHKQVHCGLNGKVYLMHRLVWLYTYGSFPAGEIDHIDGDGSNNALSNLRVVDRTDNNKNAKIRSDNSSGVVGLEFYGRLGKWKAVISCNGIRKHLGYFEDKFDAICARKSAENKYGYHVNHGRLK